MSGINYNSVYSQHGLPQPPVFRRLTAVLRMRPSLFIAGAQKAGTTSLADYLAALPGIIGPWEKEIAFFNNDQRYALGSGWYSSFFATRLSGYRKRAAGSSHCLTFDASANYFEEIKAAPRIKKFDPDARVVVLLRDPVLRAWSHYKMACKYGFETLSFRDALMAEDERIASNTMSHNFAFQRLGYRSKGEYIRYLPAWTDTFGDNLLVLFFEELFGSSPASLNKLHEFLGIAAPADSSMLIRKNKGSEEMIPSKDRELLKEHYHEYNRRLSGYLKRDLPW